MLGMMATGAAIWAASGIVVDAGRTKFDKKYRRRKAEFMDGHTYMLSRHERRQVKTIANTGIDVLSGPLMLVADWKKR